ncbi:MAG: hypothetical protein M1821_009378 [Bathelium mastoideum]|nr:MAG: hypothetical protein M1821_009378 [Bathelium mastoideum]
MDPGNYWEETSLWGSRAVVVPDTDTSFYCEMLGKYIQRFTIQHDHCFKLRGAPQVKSLADFNHLFIERELPFPFLSLPPELRTRVYEYVVAENTRDGAIYFPSDLGEDLEYWEYPSVTRVSQQIRTEVLPFFFGGTKFCFRYGTDLCRFIEHIGDDRIFIRDLGVDASSINHQMHVQVFDSLRTCPRLRRLELSMRCYDTPEVIQERLYHDAKSWIHYIAMVRGRKQAALEVLCVPRYVPLPEEQETELNLDDTLGWLIDEDPVLDAWFSVREP